MFNKEKVISKWQTHLVHISCKVLTNTFTPHFTSVIDKWIVLEFPLANSEQAALMRLMTLPCGYPRESESQYLPQDTGQLL